MRYILYGVLLPLRKSSHLKICNKFGNLNITRLGAVFPHRYHRTFVAILHSLLPEKFAEALRDLLSYLLTNSTLPSEDDSRDISTVKFPHPELAILALQNPNPVVLAGPSSPYAEAFGALDVLGFLERYESQITLCINNLIEHKIESVCPGCWDQQILPSLRTWLFDSVVPYISRPYARGLANRT